MEMENMKKNLSCDLWFSLPQMKVTTTVSSGSEKFMSLKKHLLPNSSYSVTFVDILKKTTN